MKRYRKMLCAISLILATNLQMFAITPDQKQLPLSVEYCLAENAAQQQTTIEELVIANCKNSNITTLRGIDKAKKLEVLDASGNKLINISTELTKNKQLKELFLSNNQITTIPKEIAMLEKLEIVDLSGNRLTEVPTAINQLRKLETLNLSTNRLSFFPEIPKLVNLKYLLLDYNQLVRMPTLEHIALRELNVDGNILAVDQINVLGKQFTVEKSQRFSIKPEVGLIANNYWDWNESLSQELIEVSNGEQFFGNMTVAIEQVFNTDGSTANFSHFVDSKTGTVTHSANVLAKLQVSYDGVIHHVLGELPIQFIAKQTSDGGNDDGNTNNPGDMIEELTTINVLPPSDGQGTSRDNTMLVTTADDTIINSVRSERFFVDLDAEGEKPSWFSIFFLNLFSLKTVLILVLFLPLTIAFYLFRRLNKYLNQKDLETFL